MPEPSPKFGLDTSYIVALLCPWHRFHPTTASTWKELRRNHARLVLSAHALLECFSVLTRMPPPFRVSPDKAEQALAGNFSQGVETAALAPELCWATIRELSQLGLGGGLIYDAVIARSVRRAGATVLLTWNVQDFLRVAPAGLEIREP